MSERYLIETDFLFGLRSSDKLHTVIKSFSVNISGQSKVFLSGASLLEVPLVLLGEGYSNSAIRDSLAFMKQALLSLVKYSILLFSFDDSVRSFALRLYVASGPQRRLSAAEG